MRKLNKVIAAVLMFQGLWGLVASIKFIIIDGQQLTSVNEGDLRSLLNKEVLTLISTAVSMLFAIKLSSGHNNRYQLIQNLVAVILILANGLLLNWIEQLPILERFLALLGF